MLAGSSLKEVMVMKEGRCHILELKVVINMSAVLFSFVCQIAKHQY